MPKHIDQLPVVHVPDNYPYVMPAVMAQAAMEYGPIFRIDWPALSNAVCLVGPEANKLVLHTCREHFSHERGWGPISQALLGRGILMLDDPEHLYYRKLLNSVMTAQYAASHFDLICEVIQQRMASWEDQQVIDLTVEMQAITFAVVARSFCHIEDKARIALLGDAFHRLVLSGDPQKESRTQFLAHFDAQREINQLLEHEMEQRKQNQVKKRAGEGDAIDLLTRAVDMAGQPLKKPTILAHLRTILTAGFETSTVLGCALLHSLAVHPTYLERLSPEFALLPRKAPPSLVLARLKEMRLLGYALQEAERLYGPSGNLQRGVIKAFEFAGYMVPEGAFLLLSIAGGHRLPTAFSQPACFDPDRFATPREEDKRTPYALLPFGSGTRMCSGVHLAQIEMKAIAALILQQWQLEPVNQRGMTIGYFSPDGYLEPDLLVRVRRRVVSTF